jgi:hemoglobin
MEQSETNGRSGISEGKPTIFEYAGGAPALLKLTEAFYPKVKTDPLLEAIFEDFTDEHAKGVPRTRGVL